MKFCENVHSATRLAILTISLVNIPLLLIKLANRRVHERKTWYTHVLNRFHDDHNQHSLRQIFFKVTSSLLNIANGCMHEYETWYALGFNRFHDNQTTKYSLRRFLINSLLHFHNFLSIPHMEMKLVTHVGHIVSMTTKQQIIAWGNFRIIYFFTPINCSV